MLKMAVGQSDDVDAQAAVAEAIEQCRAQVGATEPTAGVLVVAQDSFDPALSGLVQAAFPGIQLIGSTSAAEMSSIGGYREDSVVLAVFASDNVHMAAGFGDHIDSDARAAARDAVGQATASLAEEPRVCIVLTEGNHGQLALEALTELLPPDTLIVGGAAGRHDLGAVSATFQFLNDRVSSFGVAILLMAGPIFYSTAVGTGWRTLGPRGVVTRSEYGIVHEIEGRPAADWIGDYLNIHSAATFGNPLAVQDAGMDGWYLRVVLSPSDGGGLRVTGGIPEGATLQLTTTNPDDMLRSTSESLDLARRDFPAAATPQAALFFSCAVRKFLLGSRTDEEISAARSVLPGSLPMAGMYCMGEIAPAGSATDSRLLNETFVTVLLGS